jgi:hypothetical protein
MELGIIESILREDGYKDSNIVIEKIKEIKSSLIHQKLLNENIPEPKPPENEVVMEYTSTRPIRPTGQTVSELTGKIIQEKYSPFDDDIEYHQSFN